MYRQSTTSSQSHHRDTSVHAVRRPTSSTVQIEEMLETADDELDRTPIRSALVEGGKKMQKKFQKRRHQLKVRKPRSEYRNCLLKLWSPDPRRVVHTLTVFAKIGWTVARGLGGGGAGLFSMCYSTELLRRVFT